MAIITHDQLSLIRPFLRGRPRLRWGEDNQQAARFHYKKEEREKFNYPAVNISNKVQKKERNDIHCCAESLKNEQLPAVSYIFSPQLDNNNVVDLSVFRWETMANFLTFERPQEPRKVVIIFKLYCISKAPPCLDFHFVEFNLRQEQEGLFLKRLLKIFNLGSCPLCNGSINRAI